LRSLEAAITQEAQHIPILNDILDHKVIGPAIKQGLRQGLQQGRQEGALAVLRKLIEKRFGALPVSVEECLASFTEPELEAVSVRVLDAKSIDDLFEL
jgi:hypothetical protein